MARSRITGRRVTGGSCPAARDRRAARDRPAAPDRRAARAAALLVAAGLAVAGLAVAGCSSGAKPGATGGQAGQAGPGSSGEGSQAAAAKAGRARPPAYFPAAPGDTWVYASFLSGRAAGTTETRVTAVSAVSGGRQATMVMRDGAAAGRDAVYVFHDDGTISVPVTQFPATGISLASGSVLWPDAAQLAAGQTRTGRLVFAVRIAGKRVRVPATVTVRGKGTQTVTVPAGTYRAQLVDERLSMVLDGLKLAFTVDTWVAPGVGPVQVRLTGNGTGSVQDSIQELRSFTTG
jgi:hypothetical protein